MVLGNIVFAQSGSAENLHETNNLAFTKANKIYLSIGWFKYISRCDSETIPGEVYSMTFEDFHTAYEP